MSTEREGSTRPWRGDARAGELRALLSRFLGPARADAVFALDAPACAAARWATAIAPMPLWCSWPSGSWHAPSARLRRGSWWPRWCAARWSGRRRSWRSSTRPRRSWSTAAGWSSSRRELEAATARPAPGQRPAAQLDQLKDDFIATVSHELRTPLTSIRSFSEILRDVPDLSRRSAAQFLDVLVKELERLTRLINDILDVSKIEAGKMEWHITRFDLDDVVRDAIAATSACCASGRSR